jgi:hypothetical protein
VTRRNQTAMPRTHLTTASNTLAPALAVLRESGYEVTREATGDRLYRAENAHCVLTAEDPLLLLGLARLHEARGSAWPPTDAEVDAFLALEGE